MPSFISRLCGPRHNHGTPWMVHGTWCGTRRYVVRYTVHGAWYGTPEAYTRTPHVRTVAPWGKLPCASGKRTARRRRVRGARQETPGRTCQLSLAPLQLLWRLDGDRGHRCVPEPWRGGDRRRHGAPPLHVLPELSELQGRGAWQQHTEEKHRGQLGGAHAIFLLVSALGFGLWRNYLEVRRRSLQE